MVGIQIRMKLGAGANIRYGAAGLCGTCAKTWTHTVCITHSVILRLPSLAHLMQV